VGAKLDLPPPPTVTGRGGGSGWVELARARDDIEAHLLTGRLNEAGVETTVVKDRFAPGAWLYGGSNPWAPVSVYVRRFQLEEARLVLAEISYQAPSAKEPEPKELPARMTWKWWLVAVAMGIVLTWAAVVESARL
jgi:Putative prokaryotic signal transducing protein